MFRNGVEPSTGQARFSFMQNQRFKRNPTGQQYIRIPSTFPGKEWIGGFDEHNLMAKNAKNAVDEKYNWSHCTKELQQLYNNI